MNQNVTFITGNQAKADYLAKYLGHPVDHHKVDLDEIQSLDLKEIVDHKVRQAFKEINSPVLVEDVSLEFKALGRLPGPFIKFFLEDMSLETVCRIVDGMDRSAIARCVFGYYDGNEVRFFEGELPGTIAENPSGDNGFGWDKIFIPQGYDVTRAELDEEHDKATYLKLKPFEALKQFFEENA